jgi:hypothetical protein
MKPLFGRWLANPAVERVLTLLYPAAFGIAYVVLTLSSLPTTLWDLIRPSVIVGGAAIMLTICLSLLLRSRHRGAIAASALIVAASAPFILAAALGAGVAVVVLQLVRRAWTVGAIRSASAPMVSRGVGVYASSFLLVAAIVSGPAALGSVPTADRAPLGQPGAYPNIYLMLLDGYPRGDVLASLFGHDNQPFETELSQRGFMVASEGHSNYAHSWVTMTSMLHGEFIDDIPGLLPPSDAPPDQFRSLMAALNDGQMIDLLREHGYEIATIPPPFRSLSLSTADRYLDGGQLTDFEYQLLAHSQLGRLLIDVFPDFLVDQQRDRFQSTLRRVEALAQETGERPRFLLAHIFSPPHAPLVYGADGEELPLADCVPDTCRLWEYPEDAWTGLGDQVTYLNSRLIPTIDRIINADPRAVIVLMADHGARRSPTDLGEYFHAFFAARTPGEDPFPQDSDPVNVLRRLADAYMATDLGALPYQSWYSPVLNRPLNLAPYPP